MLLRTSRSQASSSRDPSPYRTTAVRTPNLKSCLSARHRHLPGSTLLGTTSLPKIRAPSPRSASVPAGSSSFCSPTLELQSREWFSATPGCAPRCDIRTRRCTTLQTLAHPRSATSWHQLLSQLHGIPRRQSNIIRRSPKPPSSALRRIAFWNANLDRALSDRTEIAGTRLSISQDRKAGFFAGRQDRLASKTGIQFRARRKNSSVEHRCVDQLY